MQLIAEVDKLPVYTEHFRFRSSGIDEDEKEHEPYKIYEILVDSIPVLIITRHEDIYAYTPAVVQRVNNDLLWSLRLAGKTDDRIKDAVKSMILPRVSSLTEHIRETSALKEQILDYANKQR